MLLFMVREVCVFIFGVRDVPVRDMDCPPSCRLTWGEGWRDLTQFGGERMSRIHIHINTQALVQSTDKQTHILNGPVS